MKEQRFIALYKEVEHVLLNYYSRGNIEGDSKISSQAFHEVAAMYSVGEEGALQGGPVSESLFPVVDSFEVSKNSTVVIAYIDITGNAASARVDSDNINGYNFTDYFNLLKVNGEWKIVNKIFVGHE